MKMLCESGKMVEVVVKDSDPVNLNRSIFIEDKDSESLLERFSLNIYRRSGSRNLMDHWFKSIEFDHYPTENEMRYWIIKVKKENESSTHGYYAIVEKHYELKEYYV